ncbi:phosphotransferase [Cohnella lupini]|uniref:Ser/Thr protein kinase RdoA (MazF antagonist) n=1 Tax=Cohnella lupini TaxID=1294267 RepID=A0A3D9HYY1_9BACL|nr:phosphotransferase [Cohnella lupini]RED54704.1 Ser/Thr protein kinase RdoA (MazF antagonist) [Cohnella lupini]
MPFDQVLSHYFSGGNWVVAKGQSGWNNTTRFIEAEGRKWVLRIYETHKDMAKIRYEHELLLALNEKSLPFLIPVPVRSRNGGTIVKLEDGTERLACLFHHIEGERPEMGNRDIAYLFGIASGQLSRALDGLSLEGQPMYPPYYEMDSAHPLCAPEDVAKFCYSPPETFQSDAAALRLIGESIERFRGYLPQFKTLPHQLIHGDINHSNSLVEAGNKRRLAAILDFEFCTWDLRAMEIAVLISGFLNEEGAMVNVDRFLNGVGEQLRLDRSEAEAIPLLVQLRILDVFLHFLGRYWDGVDGIDVLREQTQSAYEGLQKLEFVDRELLKLCLRHLTA